MFKTVKPQMYFISLPQINLGDSFHANYIQCIADNSEKNQTIPHTFVK